MFLMPTARVLAIERLYLDCHSQHEVGNVCQRQSNSIFHSSVGNRCLGADFEQEFKPIPLCFILFRNFFSFISKNSQEIL